MCPTVQIRFVCLIGSRLQQKEGKIYAVLFGFQKTGGGYRENPLTFHTEKLRGEGYNQAFLIFKKFFELRTDSCDPLVDRLL